MFERAVSVSEVSGCPPHHNAKPQGVSVQLHFQLSTHNPASYSIGIWKNTVIMGTLCQGCSFVMFHIIHSCLCLLKPSEKWSWKMSWLHGHFANRFKVFHRRKPSKSSNPTILWRHVRCYRNLPPSSPPHTSSGFPIFWFPLEIGLYYTKSCSTAASISEWHLWDFNGNTTEDTAIQHCFYLVAWLWSKHEINMKLYPVFVLWQKHPWTFFVPLLTTVFYYRSGLLAISPTM